MFKKPIIFSIFFCLLTTIITDSAFGFCPRFKPMRFCWGDGRRPQVMTDYQDCVIDYNGDCDCEIQSRTHEDAPPAIPITPDMLKVESTLNREFHLAKGDILEISVFGDEETFISSTAVAPDGYLYYAFLDRMEAAGKTPKELATNLEEALEKLFINPRVSVVPKTIVTQSYKVLGRVQSPGVFPLLAPTRLRDAIGEAGGLLMESFRDKISNAHLYSLVDLGSSYIIRDGKRINVNFESLLTNGDDSQNIFLRAGDYIYIAPAERFEVYITGNVNTPRRLVYRRGVTLMAAVAQSGGWVTPNPYSPNLNRVFILRGCFECPTYLLVDVQKILRGEARDVYLCPGDIIYFPNKKFRFARELIRSAVESFVQAFAGSAAATYAQVNWFTTSPSSGGSD